MIAGKSILEGKKLQFTTGIRKQQEDVPQTVICPCADYSLLQRDPYGQISNFFFLITKTYAHTYAEHML